VERRIGIVLLLVALLVGGAVAAPFGNRVRFTSDGAFTAVESGSIAQGSFALTTVVRPQREAPRVDVVASDLNVTRDALRRLPEMRVFLIAPGGAERDVGRMRVSSRGRARLRRRGPARLFPDGVESFREMAGGTVEVRRLSPSPATVLRATIGSFTADHAGESVSTRKVFGRIEGRGVQPQGSGSFELRIDDTHSGALQNRIHVVASRFFVGTYSVLLFRSNGSAVTLGSFFADAGSSKGLLLDSRGGALPGGITNLADFSDGKIEIRRGSSVVGRGFVPPFRGVDEPGIAKRNAKSWGVVELSPTGAGGAATGVIRAGVTVYPRRREQSFRLRVIDLPPSKAPYSVFVTAATGTVTRLGSFATRGANGYGSLGYTTLVGDRMPGDDVVRLSRQSLEVRNADNEVVLSGTFPRVD
jgi:hypothetical protein